MTNLTGSGGPNSFVGDMIDGYARSTVRFPFNSGLAVSTSGVIPSNAYTAVILFRFDAVTGFRRVMDATNGTLDDCGAYVQNQRYEFEPTNTSPIIQPNTYFQAVIVREASGRVRAYRDGVLRVDLPNDQGCFQISSGNLRFFQDDFQISNEASAGNVARIRLYDAPLTDSQVQALDRVPQGTVTANTAVVFASERDGNREIYAMNADGSGQVRLTNNPANDSYPDWSPDGSKIVFRSNRDGNEEIYVMNADGSNLVRLTTNTARDTYPVWSPDGSKIAFTSNRDGNDEIYVMNANGSSQTRLTNNSASDYEPSWSPNGSQIVFGSNRDGDSEIFKMNADGSNPVQLTSNTVSEGQPAWSPDGSKIAFWSNRDGNLEIYTMNADGTGQTRLTNNPAEDSKPSWSPDSTKLTFASGVSTAEIYTMNANGSSQTQLTFNSVNDFFPDWRSQSTPPADCVYTLSSSSITVSAVGAGELQVGVNTQNGCSWTATSNASWITVTDGSGNGNGNVFFNVAANNGNARIATITIAGQTFTVSQSAGIAPPNDNFVNAQTISGVSGNTTGSNVGASAETGEPAHAGIPAARSIWYKWRAPEDGLFSFTTTGSSFDTTLAVYTGTAVNALTAIASNDDNAPFDLTGRVVFRAFANTDYYIAVDGKNNESGIVNLIWKQSARSYRFYAQTGNGNVSPRIPVITAVRNTDGAQYTAQNIAAGIFELDLPVDNAVYTVNIGGVDQWSPNTFILDNSSVTSGSDDGSPAVPNAPTGLGGTFVTNAVTVSATVTGSLTGVTSTNGVTVSLGSEGGPNPIAPIPCPLSIGPTGTVAYACQFIVDTRHQIKPTLINAVFNPANRPYEPLSSSPLPGPGTAFTMATGTTFNISGRITSNGVNLPNAVVKLTGRKANSYITTTDGTFQFTGLPAGGDYTVTTTLAGFTFAPQVISNLQSNVNLNITSQSSCQYSISASGTTMSAASGTGSFEVITTNGCPWAVANTASWITVNSGSGNGTGRVYFTVQPNNGTVRNGVISLGGQNFTVSQSDGCTYIFNASGQNFPAAGGSGGFNVTPSSSGCVWQPTTSDYCMLNISGGGPGGGPVNFTVGVNPGVSRSATIKVGEQIFTINQEAAPGVHRARYDFDGDGRADIAVFRPETGVWYIQTATAVLIEQFGITGDIPQAADYDGDGKTDLTIFRPNGANGAEWWSKRSSDGVIFAVQFGAATDKPVPADYTGDGKTDIAVWRPSTGEWFVLRSEDYSYFAVPFGQTGDIPVTGDFDGGGISEMSVFRPSTAVWYSLNIITGGINIVQFGSNGDIPVVADYDGDGKADIAVYRPSDNVWYRINSSTNGFVSYQFGTSGDIPVIADYNGDKRADITVYRPSTGFWLIWSCTVNSQYSGIPFGLPTDIPVQNPVMP